MQSYLRDTIHAQAVYLRRQAAIAQAEARLAGRSKVPESERAAVLDLVEQAHQDRAEHLGTRF